MLTSKKIASTIAAILAVPLLAVASPALAGVSVGCDAGTLNGVYSYAYTGFNIVAGAAVPFSIAGFASYNGAGALVGEETSTTTVSGKVVVSRNTYTGTYTITANCAIKETDKDNTSAISHYDEFTGPLGSAINFVETDPGVVSAAVETRD